MLPLVMLPLVTNAALSIRRPPVLAYGPAVRRRCEPRISLADPRGSTADTVTALLELLPRGGQSQSKKTPEQRARIRALVEELESVGASTRYLDNPRYASSGGARGGELLWDNYELAYFDRSIDGGRGSADDKSPAGVGAAATPQKNERSAGLRSRLLASLFRLRYSFQHLLEPNGCINYVGISALGIPASITTLGTFTRLSDGEVAALRAENGTPLRSDTSVRIDFDRPRLSIGPSYLPLTFEFAAGQSPPVNLCTTYVDDRVRLCLAAKGGRLVFTRGGLAAEPIADEWQALLTARPLKMRSLAVGSLVAVATSVALIPTSRVSLKLIKWVALLSFAAACVRMADNTRNPPVAPTR